MRSCRAIPAPPSSPAALRQPSGKGAVRELHCIRPSLHPRSLQRPALRSGRDGQGDSYYSSVAYLQVGALLAPCARGAGTFSVRTCNSLTAPTLRRGRGDSLVLPDRLLRLFSNSVTKVYC